MGSEDRSIWRNSLRRIPVLPGRKPKIDGVIAKARAAITKSRRSLSPSPRGSVVGCCHRMGSGGYNHPDGARMPNWTGRPAGLDLAPEAELVACLKCEAWPMALKIVKPPWSSRPMIQFTYPKCHFCHGGRKARIPEAGLQLIPAPSAILLSSGGQDTTTRHSRAELC
jgi:hypothetical protein